jgi:hypothetical protein
MNTQHSIGRVLELAFALIQMGALRQAQTKPCA